MAAAAIRMPEPVEVATQSLRVLLIEDDPYDAELIVHELRSGGFEVSVDISESEEDIRKRVEDGNYDIVLTDCSLPQWLGIGPIAL